MKHLKFLILAMAILVNGAYGNVSAAPWDQPQWPESGGYCDSSVEVSISPDIIVAPGEAFQVDWSAGYSTYEPVDGGRNYYEVSLYRDGSLLQTWTADTDSGQQPPEGGSYAVPGGVTADTEFSVTASVTSDISCPGGTSASESMTVTLNNENPTETCAINSFTADNSNPSYNTGTTLRYSLKMVGVNPFTWNITLLNGTNLPSPSSGTGTSGTSATGNLTQGHTYRLTCGEAISDVTVTPQSPPQATCQDQGANNYGGPLPCTYSSTCQDRNATNYGGALPCTYPPYVETCTNPVATNYGRPLPCTFAPTCQDQNATNYGGPLPCNYPPICQDAAANNFGGPLPCDYTAPTCSANSECISAASYVSGGGTRIRANWIVSPACSGTAPVIQNVVRFRNVEDGWSMNNYFARPPNERSFMFPNYFAPGSYEVSIKTHNINSRSVNITLPCDPVAPTGTISATSCEIPVGASTCDSLVTWSISNPTSGATEITRNNPPNTHLSFDNSGNNIPSTIRYGVDGTSTFFLIHNVAGTPTTLGQAVATATCSPSSIWDGTICKAIPEAMTGTLIPDTASCKIPLNKSNCKINFTWNTTNPEAVSQVTRNPANTVVGEGNSGSGEFVVKYDTETFFLYNNAVELAESTVASSCTTGTEWNGVRCIEIDDGGCKNGATNPPKCTTNPGGQCMNGATNPPICTTNPGNECLNGAVNPPECTITDGGICVNGAVNPPICTIDEEGSCLNGTFNPPLCTQTRKPTFQED